MLRTYLSVSFESSPLPGESWGDGRTTPRISGEGDLTSVSGSFRDLPSPKTDLLANRSFLESEPILANRLLESRTFLRITVQCFKNTPVA